MISVSCTCGRRFKAEDQHAGKRTKCPVCGNMLVIGQSAGIGPSGVKDNGEVPSWWFPTSPSPKATTTVTPIPTRSGSGSGSGSDPDDLPTMVIPSQPGFRPGSQVGGRGGSPGSTQSGESGPRASRLPVALLGGALAMAVVGLSVILWLQTGGNGVGPAPNPPAAAPGQPGKGEDRGANQLEATAEARGSAPEAKPANRAGAWPWSVSQAQRAVQTGRRRARQAAFDRAGLLLSLRPGYESMATPDGRLLQGADRGDRQPQQWTGRSPGSGVCGGHRRGQRQRGQGHWLRQHRVR